MGYEYDVESLNWRPWVLVRHTSPRGREPAQGCMADRAGVCRVARKNDYLLVRRCGADADAKLNSNIFLNKILIAYFYKFDHLLI